MRIGIVAPAAPGVTGGAERLWESLAQRLRTDGNDHSVDIVTLAVPETTLDEVMDAYGRFIDLDVSRFDLVISGKYPAWMVNHDRKLLYLLHPLRGLYDTYPVTLGSLSDTNEGRRIDDALARATSAATLLTTAREQLTQLSPDHPLRAFPGPLARNLVHRLDRFGTEPASTVSYAAISNTVADRVDYLPEVPVLIAHPESGLETMIGSSIERSEFFTASRLDKPKRIDLVISAFSQIRDPIARLTIAGDGPERERLQQLAAPDSRISFLGRISDRELASRYASATAVVFAPLDEDFGYITLEAMAAGTPVITTTDAGGPTELVEHGINGLVLEPTPERLAWGMRHVSELRYDRWQMGLNARRRASMVSWDRLIAEINRLLHPPTQQRPRALVLSTYGIEPAVGGGQRRMRYLCRALASVAEVTVLVSSTAPTQRRRLEPGLDQIMVQRSKRQRAAEAIIFDELELPVDDLTAGLLAATTPAFGQELDRLLTDTDIVVLTHPFLEPALPEVELPIVYDSQNAEHLLKRQLLPDTLAGNWLASLALGSERALTRRADLVVACTDDDLAAISSLARSRDVPGTVVANGVDTAQLQLRTPEDQAKCRAELLASAGLGLAEDRPIAVFIGSWHPPNVAAAEIVLTLAELRPDWLFVLAGSHTSSFAERPDLPANVHLIAVFPESQLWTLLAGADVALNPMVSGGGSNLKVYDYLAVGVPVLTTEVGARGLAKPGETVVVVEPTAEALAAGLDRTGATGLERLELGRALVESEFDWQGLGTAWATALLELIDENTVSLNTVSTNTGRANSVPRPIMATTLPPDPDPVIAAMDALAYLAKTTPPPQETIMSPIVREQLKRARANRAVGRKLPSDARFRPAKRVLIRLGHFLSNEQVVYNEATLEVLEALTAQVDLLQGQQQELLERLDELDQPGVE